MPTYYEWTCKKREKKAKQGCPKFEVTSHPLKIHKHVSSKSFIDQINKWSAVFEEIDPLMKFEKMNIEETNDCVEITNERTNYNKAWKAHRVTILNKYTTGEKLTIISSFLPEEEKTLIRQVSNLNEKVKHRLEQLDEIDEGSIRRTMGLSQQEYVANINMLSDEIKKAWNTEQRVKAFKIAIQCSKMLSDVSVMQFYPSKFILITDILDTFGNLVFDRLKEKSFGQKSARTVVDIDSSAVPDAAKETCQNWMFKMASIRELLPRLYMEMSLLKCCVFISKQDIEPAITRLTIMIRGIGNPLVAVYLRMYLCHIASGLLANEDCNKHFRNNFKEFLEEYQQIFHPMMKRKYESQLLTLDKYLNLYLPAVQGWLLFGALDSEECKLTLLDKFVNQCEQIENNELILYILVSAFDSQTVIKKMSKILEIIHINTDKMVMTSELLASLGEHLCAGGNSGHSNSETWIQTWWKVATNIKSTSNFLQVLGPWLQFACTHLSTQHINIILRGTIRYMIKCGQSPDDFAGSLQAVLKRTLMAIPEVEELFLMDAFMPLVELSQSASARTAMAKLVLSIFFSRYSSVQIEDHITITCLMRLCSILHDSISAVTVDDESKVCAELINKYVQLVTFQEDYEQQLNFYVESRAAFIKLDAVLVTLVHCVNALSARVPTRARWLQRACAAYCFVTVPSLRCVLTKAHLYLLSGQVALLNNCVGQAEANFKALISLMADIPEYTIEDGQKKLTHTKVAGLISDLLSTLLILPDNVDSNCKAYILSGFIRTLERIHWKKTDPLYYTALLHTLDLLCEMTQEHYAYSIESVMSNDELYGNDSEFIEAIEKHATNICQELLVVLKELGDGKETKKQYNLSLELFWRITRRGDLDEAPMFSLAVNLWLLAQKINNSSDRLGRSMLAALEADDDPCIRRLLQKLSGNAKTP